jgi:hypothetical protein
MSHAFIVADEEDWPRQLYPRLGFDQSDELGSASLSAAGGGDAV